MSTLYCVYRIVCFPSGKCYIGQTNKFNRRKTEHFIKLKKGWHHSRKLQNAFDKYGIEAFYIEPIEDNIEKSLICEREKYWISVFNSFHNGYNHTSGEDGLPPPPNKNCTWNGIKYKSIREAAEAWGVNVYTMYSRIEKGYTKEEDVPLHGHPSPVYWNGIQYQSCVEAAKVLGVSAPAMQQRIKKGYTCDDDVIKSKQCIWNGVTYASIREAAKANDISASNMGERLLSGYTCDADMPGALDKPCLWNGIMYATLTAAAYACDIDRSTMQYRITQGYVCDADLRKNTRRKQCIWNGVVYPSLRAAGDAIGLSHTALIKRLKKGYVCDEDVISNDM